MSHGYIVAAVEHHDQSPAISFNRVPGPSVQEHQYDLYTEEWIDYLEVRRGDFHCRNQQVIADIVPSFYIYVTRCSSEAKR